MTPFHAGMAGEYIMPIIQELLTMMKLPNMVLAGGCWHCIVAGSALPYVHVQMLLPGGIEVC